jgi:hypothetical protein
VGDFLSELAEAVKQMEALLRDRRACRFVPVMMAEEVLISGTLKLLDALKHLHIPVKALWGRRWRSAPGGLKKKLSFWGSLLFFF